MFPFPSRLIFIYITILSFLVNLIPQRLSIDEVDDRYCFRDPGNKDFLHSASKCDICYKVVLICGKNHIKRVIFWNLKKWIFYDPHPSPIWKKHVIVKLVNLVKYLNAK